MVIGVLTVALEIPGADSLKDKRRVVKSLLDGVRRKFNISAAEVGDNDVWRRATIGMACVSNEQGMANRILSKVGDFIEAIPEVILISTNMEYL